MTICCTEEHYLATLQVHDDDNVGYGGDYGDDDDDDDCDGGDCDIDDHAEPYAAHGRIKLRFCT